MAGQPAPSPGPTHPLSNEFGPFDERVWLNTAHQGPLPRVAGEAAAEAAAWKVAPHRLTAERFRETPARLRAALARLLGAREADLVLANGASYGLHLLANGLPLRAGDEVIVFRDDFPSDVLPWIGLRARGVEVRFLEPSDGPVPSGDDVAAALRPATKVLCLTLVHSFSGGVIDAAAIGAMCRDAGVWFVLNATQAVGARPVDVEHIRAAAVLGAGWKWLCGPYGTGYLWLRPDVTERLEYNRRYWLSSLTADDLATPDVAWADLPPPTGAHRYDLFATANFLNFVPWTVAIEHLLEIGVERIATHDQALVQMLIDGLDGDRHTVRSPTHPADRSTLVLIEPRAEPAAAVYGRLRDHGIDVALRRGLVRVSPHLHNAGDDVGALLAGLHGSAG